MELKAQPRPVRRLTPGTSVTVVNEDSPHQRMIGLRALTPVPQSDRVGMPAQLTTLPVGPPTLPRLNSPATGHGEVPREPAVVIERMAVEDVSIAYGAKAAVKSVSLSIRQGEVLALIGPSGCGKTTLLRSLNRLTELTQGASLTGHISLDGDDITDFEATDLRRQVTMVFQQPNPFPMSIFDNVAYVLREQSRRRPGKAALRAAVESALDRAGLLEEVKHSLDHPALRLSGGQQQRLCIARALAANPEVLLLDEPCSALDPQSTAVIEDLIVKLRKEVAVVIVTHNLQQARRVADHVAFMYLGELVEYAPATRLFSAPVQARTREYIAGAFG